MAAGGVTLCRAEAETGAPSASPVTLGEPVEAVEARLGPPDSYFGMGDRMVYYYEAGHVEFTNAAVASAVWHSPEALADQARRREEAEARQREQARALAEHRREEGLRVLDAKLADPDFQVAPAAERVVFWRGFRAAYPEIPATREYQTALLEWAREERTAAEEARQDAAMAAMTRQVEQARLEALRAEEEAALNRRRIAELEQASVPVRLPSPPEAAADPVVVLETIYYGSGGIWRRPEAEPTEPRPPPRSRYGVESRLGPQGTPVFGVRP
jgi:hypothetical protein